MEKQRFLEYINLSFQQENLVKITLSKNKNIENKSLQNIYIVPIILKNEKMLKFTYHYDQKDITKNFNLKNALTELAAFLDNFFYNAYLFTLEKNYELKISKKGKGKIFESKASFSEKPDYEHNREKKYLVSNSEKYLHLLGITTEDGKIKKNFEDKYRQINKFIEILDSLLKNIDLSSKKELNIIDMGSGKGYLTFALYDYLNNKLNIPAKVTGVEIRQDLIKKCTDFANILNFKNLYFDEGYINYYEIKEIDGLIALHACNTATDDAIFQGIKANAEFLLLSPCCHKELNPQLSCNNELNNILQYGILRERQAEILTDAIRAMLLESCGYQSNVFEFISTEHTGKNLMISAIKKRQKRKSGAILKDIDRIKKTFGIESQHLEKLLLENNLL